MILILCLLLTQTGCWGGRELNARAFVTAIAFDLTKDEELQEEQYLISIQLPVPERMAGGEGQGAGEGKPFVVLGSTAKTVITGILQLQRQLDRKLFLGHTHLILISEEVATAFGVNQVIDYFLRDFSIQRMTRLAVVDGKARDILELEPPMGQTPSAYILNLLSPQSGSSFTYITDLGKLQVLQSLEGIDPVLPRLSKGQETELTGGVAVLKNGYFRGWLGNFETRGLNILHNEFVESEYEVECPLHPGDQIVVGVNELRSVYRLEEAGGTPRVKIMV
ncbi:MAG: Ger(x)C family spore germination protein [Firmicutes bacterium]|nr:Ger(x)C family spore germination protein [Bacillota bacterium]